MWNRLGEIVQACVRRVVLRGVLQYSPPGKNVLIQLQNVQVAEDDVEGDHWTLEEEAGQATAEEEEVEVAEAGHVE